MAYHDILYDKRDGVATITINRPKVLNAFRAETVEEMLAAMRDADNDPDIGVIVLAGSGDRAFCSGGDNSARSSGSESEEGYGGRGLVGLPIEELHSAIRDSRKPVIAKVQGYAIGGGNVLATVCDLTIASEKAVFGQVGPRVGSVDPGWGTAYLARLVGEKRAREIWFLCRRYTAAEAFQMGLVNKVVPADKLDAEVEAWCQRSWRYPQPRLPSPSARSTPTARTSAASARSASRHWRSTTTAMRQGKGPRLSSKSGGQISGPSERNDVNAGMLARYGCVKSTARL
jgi:2-ketocyclohexanecarboxyl-CoA hydrolase